MPDKRDGTRIGIIAIDRKTLFPIMQLFVSANAKINAKEIVITIVIMEINKLLYIEYTKAGFEK